MTGKPGGKQPESTANTALKLDIEDEQSRERRIQSSLERLNLIPSSFPQKQPFQFDFVTRPTPHHVPPPTELLSRVRAFLPAMEASNIVLADKAKFDPASVNMESITENAQRYIEMNLGLGIFEQRHSNFGWKRDASQPLSSGSSTSESDPTDSYDSDSSDAEIFTGFVPDRPIRPLPRRSQSSVPWSTIGSGNVRRIVVLGGEDSAVDRS